MALQHGDMIVIGSDGLWDNVFDDEILSILASPQEKELLEHEDNGGEASLLPFRAAVHLAHRAFELSVDSTWLSPFALEFQGVQNNTTLKGGKPDDITVVVAHVTEDTGVEGSHFSNICERRGGGAEDG